MVEFLRHFVKKTPINTPKTDTRTLKRERREKKRLRGGEEKE